MPNPPTVNQPEILDTDPARAEPTKGQGPARFVRSLVQGTIIQTGMQVWQSFAPSHLVMSDGQYAILSVFLLGVLAWLQVVLEDGTGVAIMRTPSGRARRRVRA